MILFIPGIQNTKYSLMRKSFYFNTAYGNYSVIATTFYWQKTLKLYSSPVSKWCFVWIYSKCNNATTSNFKYDVRNIDRHRPLNILSLLFVCIVIDKSDKILHEKSSFIWNKWWIWISNWMKPQATIYLEIRNPVIKQYGIQFVFCKIQYIGSPVSIQQFRLVIECKKICSTVLLV